MSSLRDQREKADRELGITAAYEAAVEARTELGSIQERLIHERQVKRELEYSLEQREADVVSNTWAANDGLAVTRLDKLVKIEITADPMVRELKIKLMQAQINLDTLEAERAQCEAEIKIQCARMNELQGVLIFTSALMSKSKE